MRGSQAMAVAVRAPQGNIEVVRHVLAGSYRAPLARLVFVRGVVGLWDALGLGMRSITYSANIASGEDVEFDGPVAWGTLIISFGFALGLFFLVPVALGQVGETWFGLTAWSGNLLEGLVRLGLVVAYIWAIGFFPEVTRLYGYHGAEHKTINAFESGAELTPEAVAQFPLEHPRCGTAFLLMVAVFSIVIFSALGPMPIYIRIISRLLLLPFLAALAYEYLRLTARHKDHPMIRVLLVPNMALQRLTTREPDTGMIEVAIAAFIAMRRLELDGKQVDPSAAL